MNWIVSIHVSAAPIRVSGTPIHEDDELDCSDSPQMILKWEVLQFSFADKFREGKPVTGRRLEEMRLHSEIKTCYSGSSDFFKRSNDSLFP
ncbi:unnamed protein product [Lactuca virosa]|uniref:Uncharacterized protein n=1 Tax=Lactuca virosa TaxID=75947 RepID=A0AAU9MIK7_9ASTR|nr:unnamed protein product [Lactuca virosa]